MTERSDASGPPQSSQLELHLSYWHPWGQLAPYFTALERGELVGRRCLTCERLAIPPRRVCSCGSTAMHWEPHTGWGRIKALTQNTGPAPGQEDRCRTFVLVQFDGVATLALAELEGQEPDSPDGQVKVVACKGCRGPWPTLRVRTLALEIPTE
jgi:uncharacterized OB-fold protein